MDNDKEEKKRRGKRFTAKEHQKHFRPKDEPRKEKKNLSRFKQEIRADELWDDVDSVWSE